MRLSDKDIEQHLDDEKIIISPKPDSTMISGVSVDIRLGNEFRVFQAHAAPFIDLSGPKEEMQKAMESGAMSHVYMQDDEALIRHCYWVAHNAVMAKD